MRYMRQPRSRELGNFSVTCPSCFDGPVTVIDSRGAGHGMNAQRRRRRCTVCGYKWTTYEIDETTFRALLFSLTDKLLDEIHRLRVGLADKALHDVLSGRIDNDTTRAPPSPRPPHPRTQEDRE